MKKILLILLITLQVFDCFSQTKINFTTLKNNCFKVSVYKGESLIKTGSGFVFIGNSKTDQIAIGITNEHVLDGGDNALIEFEGNVVKNGWWIIQ